MNVAVLRLVVSGILVCAIWLGFLLSGQALAEGALRQVLQWRLLHPPAHLQEA